MSTQSQVATCALERYTRDESDRRVQLDDALERHRREAERAKTGAACAMAAAEAAIERQRHVCARVTLEGRLHSESAIAALETESSRRQAAQQAASEAQAQASEAARRAEDERVTRDLAERQADRERVAATAAVQTAEAVAQQAAKASQHAANAEKRRRAVEERMKAERERMEAALASQQRKLSQERASLSAALAEQENEMQRVVRSFDERVHQLERRTMEMAAAPRERDATPPSSPPPEPPPPQQQQQQQQMLQHPPPQNTPAERGMCSRANGTPDGTAIHAVGHCGTTLSLAPPRCMSASTSCSDLQPPASSSRHEQAAPATSDAQTAVVTDADGRPAPPTTVVHVHLPPSAAGAPVAAAPAPPAAPRYESAHAQSEAPMGAGPHSSLAELRSRCDLDVTRSAMEASLLRSEMERRSDMERWTAQSVQQASREVALQQRVQSLEQQLHGVHTPRAEHAVPPQCRYAPVASEPPPPAFYERTSYELAEGMPYGAYATPSAQHHVQHHHVQHQHVQQQHVQQQQQSLSQSAYSRPPSQPDYSTYLGRPPSRMPPTPDPVPSMPPPPAYAEPLSGRASIAEEQQDFQALQRELRSIAREQLSLLSTEHADYGARADRANGDGAGALRFSPPSEEFATGSAPMRGSPPPRASPPELVPQPAAARSGAPSPPALVEGRGNAPPAFASPPPVRALSHTAAADGELQETLRLLHESRADALEQMHHSQAKARDDEREQMQELIGELRSWKRQNERRMAEMSQKSAADFLACKQSATSQPPPQEAAYSRPPRHQALGATTSAATEVAVYREAASSARAACSEAAKHCEAARHCAGRASEASSRPRTGLAAAARSVAASSSSSHSQPPNGTPLSARAGTTASGPTPRGERSLRELQRELESLKSSLSVYLGSGIV